MGQAERQRIVAALEQMDRESPPFEALPQVLGAVLPLTGVEVLSSLETGEGVLVRRALLRKIIEELRAI